LHGLVLALLQAFSELVKYLKVWEKEKFFQKEVAEFPRLAQKSINDYFWWQSHGANFWGKIRLKLKRKI